MTEKLQIYQCEVCGNIVEMIHSGVGELVCCNQPMKQFKENTVDAAKEKHVPVIEKVENGIATIPFTFRFGFSDQRTPSTVAQKGIWLFDVAHGRDVAFEMKGRIEFDGGRAGTGEITMVRKVTYGSR